jgi:hypothetical protein
VSKARRGLERLGINRGLLQSGPRGRSSHGLRDLSPRAFDEVRHEAGEGSVRLAPGAGRRLPLYRQAEIYRREGVDLDRSLMASWLGHCSWLVQPIVEAIGDWEKKLVVCWLRRGRRHRCGVLHADPHRPAQRRRSRSLPAISLRTRRTASDQPNPGAVALDPGANITSPNQYGCSRERSLTQRMQRRPEDSESSGRSTIETASSQGRLNLPLMRGSFRNIMP